MKTKTIIVTIVLIISFMGCNAQSEKENADFKKSNQKFQNAFKIALDDFDLDGDLDAVFSIQNLSQIYYNDGRGNFKGKDSEIQIISHGVATGDLNSDGYPDLFFAPFDKISSCPVFLNDGKGGFINTTSKIDNGTDVQLVDLENDGDLDVKIENGKGDMLYLNDGSGNFVKSDVLLPAYSSMNDLNGDTYIDLVSLWKGGSENRVYLNDKKGNFSAYNILPAKDLATRFFDFADIDNDGDMDIIYSKEDGKDYSGILLNDGKGKFIESGQKLAFVETGRIGTGDLNNDGWVDIIFADRLRPAQVWMNDGKGRFFDSGRRLMEGGACHSIIIRDIDNDRDLDVFIANYLNRQEKSGLWFNQLMENKQK